MMKSRMPYRWMDWLWVALAGAVALLTLVGFFGRLFWVFDLCSHFRVQLFQLSLILLFIAIWRRRPEQWSAALAVACLNYMFVLPFYFGRSDVPPGRSAVRAMVMNLNAQNTNVDAVLGEIGEHAPDLLLAMEVTPEWERALAPLNRIYPYRVARPRDDNFGIMLLSKYPLSKQSVTVIGRAAVPSILATVHLSSGNEVSFIGTHPVPPFNAEWFGLRNNQLESLPLTVRKQEHPVLLAGDLNTSPWSPNFKRLEIATGLKNSMKGFGFQPSWPAGNVLFHIPVDHLLHSPEIVIHNRFSGGRTGSDHYPVIVDFSLAGE